MTPSLIRTWLSVVGLTLICATRVLTASEVESISVESFLEAHCVECHGGSDAKSDLDLLALNRDTVLVSEFDDWSRVLEMIRSGEMPPVDRPKPEPSERRAITAWLKNKLDEFQDDSQRPTVEMRRLTNQEYEYTLQDLLGIEIRLAHSLPQDPDKPYRFNNTSEFLLMSGERLDRYRDTARRALAAAIVSPLPPKVQRMRMAWGPGTKRPQNELAISGGKRGSPKDGLKIKTWPEHGEYRIRMQAKGVFPSESKELPIRLVMGYSVQSNIGTAPFFPVGTARLSVDQSEPTIFEFRGRIENHPHQPEHKYRRGGTRTGNLVIEPPCMVITPQNLFDDGTLNDSPDAKSKPTAMIDWIEFEAPIIDPWPPDHHRQILFDSPLRESDPDQYIEQVLQRFLVRAFRRPPTRTEIERYLTIYRIHAAELDSLEEALRETLIFVLTSPNFLFVTPPSKSPNLHYQIASRLSYFLWASMPDQELMNLADRECLLDTEVIKQQANRMLNDPRRRRFVDRFTRQWLAIEKARSVPINLNLFPRFLHTVAKGERRGAEVPYRPTIRDHMLNESISFIEELIRRNATCDQLIDSDFALLNQRLAAHYGVEGVQGDKLRPVDVADVPHMGGLLTQGAILIATSTGSAPHPVYRAVWLREAILGDHVKDPPADVPALEDSTGPSASDAVTIKGLLEQHRQKESCRDCHSRLDPWGIPFEQYNAIGQFQPRVTKPGERVRGFESKRHKDLDGYQQYLESIYTVPVDATSQLPSGTEIHGVNELKSYLINERIDAVAQNVVRRLLSYAIGRDLTPRDHRAIAEILHASKANHYPLRDMVLAICQSDPFLGSQP